MKSKPTAGFIEQLHIPQAGEASLIMNSGSFAFNNSIQHRLAEYTRTLFRSTALKPQAISIF
jgi:hypothetical protein